MEVVHTFISSNFVRAIDRFDSFFGDPNLSEDNDATRIQVAFGPKFTKDADLPSLETDAKIRINLPRIERRLQLAIDTLGESDDPSTAGQVITERDRSADAALRYVIPEYKKWRFNLDAGLSRDDEDEYDPYLKLRARRKAQVDGWQMQFREVVRYYYNAGFKESTELQWDHPVKHWMFRSLSKVTWTEGTNGVMPEQRFSLYKELGRRRAMRWDVAAYWPETPHTQAAHYYTEFAFRQLVHKDWMYLEFLPRLEWAQDQDYETEPSVLIQMEVIFGEVPP